MYSGKYVHCRHRRMHCRGSLHGGYGLYGRRGCVYRRDQLYGVTQRLYRGRCVYGRPELHRSCRRLYRRTDLYECGHGLYVRIDVYPWYGLFDRTCGTPELGQHQALVPEEVGRIGV